MQGIRAPDPSRPFPITMTASGLSPEDKSVQLLPREQRKLIIRVGVIGEEGPSFRRFSTSALWTSGLDNWGCPH